MTKISECIAPNFYDLHKLLKQGKILELWLRGGRGSTKSSFASIEGLLELVKDKEANGVVFRKFENEIHDSVYAQLEWAAYQLGIHHLFRFYRSPHKIELLETKQVILFKGADNPRKIKSIKLATGYLKWTWFEEVDQFGGMEDVRNLLQSILRGTTKKQFAMFSYNPPKSARSWTNAETKIKKPGRVVHYSDYRDVPKEWLGDTFIQNAEHLKEVNPEAYKHEYLGEETGTGLEVFNNVTLRPITSKEISYFDYNFQGLDFGYSIDPLVFVQMSYDAKKRALFIFFEISGIKMSYHQLTNKLSPEQLADISMADKASPKDIDELKDDYGMNVLGAEKPPGSVDHGTKWLQDLEEIVIDPLRCPLAANEFINYALSVNRLGETINKFPDKDNHCFVGKTLISTTEGNVRIDQLSPGDMVITRKGPRRVNKIFHNGERKVVTTKLLNGKSLTLTDTHDIITKQGKIKFKDLSPSDTVYYEVNECRFIETENQKLKYLKEKNIAGIQKVKEERTGFILKEQLLMGMNTYISRSLREKLGLFQKTATYTIKMAIHSIMTFLILFALKVQSIYQNMRKNTTKGIKMLLRKILTGFALLRKYGMLPKKVESGILKMQLKPTRTEMLFNRNASFVESSMKQRIMGTLDSAQINAKQNGVETQGSTMWRKCVNIVSRPFQAISTVNKNSARENVQQVFDIEVDEVHEYFAEGFLVSNCIDATRYAMSLQIKQAKVEKRKNKHKVRNVPIMNRWR